MPDYSYAHLELLIDESGSMYALKDTVIKSVNDLIAEQIKTGGYVTISVSTFNSHGTKSRLQFALLDNGVKFDEYAPGGATPLYDAIGSRIVALGNRLSAMPETTRPGVVLFSIMTDGLENDSEEYTAEIVNAMIAEQETKYSWKFLFLGANIDVAAASRDIGVNSYIAFDFTQAGTALALDSVSRTFTSYRI